MALSGWCSQHGRPNCAGCKAPNCSHQCHTEQPNPSNESDVNAA